MEIYVHKKKNKETIAWLVKKIKDVHLWWL